MGKTLWQTYLLKEIAKIFFLILFSVYFLYFLIEYSTNFHALAREEPPLLSDYFFYSLALLSKLASLLFPLALIVATIKVLSSLNRHNELLALQTAGLSLFSLTRPFFFFACFSALLNLYNFESLFPSSLKVVNQFEHTYLKKNRSNVSPSVHKIIASDGTRLIYQRYDPHLNALIDVFLIHSIDEIWHVKTLSLTSPYPVGLFADQIVRTKNGLMEKKNFFKTHVFEDLAFSLDQTEKELAREEPLSTLFKQAFYHQELSSQERAAAKTHLYFKLTLSFLPFLLLIAIIPFCVPSTRSLPTFSILSISIFSYILFFTLLNACTILGESQLIPAHFAVLLVPLLLLIAFGLRFIRIS